MAKISNTLAKSNDGNIQITFTIPFNEVKKAKNTVLNDLNTEIDVPGFRRGKAPHKKVEERVSSESLIERTLGQILPKAVRDAVDEHKLSPALYPKFELIKAGENEDWQVRAITCELPRVDIGDYRKILEGEARTKKLWVPGKGSAKSENSQPSQEEKEQRVLQVLLESVKFKVPELLIEQEGNSRLANLLMRLEKLGLSLEGYLNSIGKSAETLKAEYKKQSENTIRLELILEAIAKEEKVGITEAEIDTTLLATVANDQKEYKRLNTPDQRRIIAAVLRRKEVLGRLAENF